MAVGVVDQLEVVDVYHHAGQERRVARRPVHLLLQLLAQGPAVHRAGQWIGGCQVPELLLTRHRSLEVIRPLEAGHRCGNDLLREAHVLLVEGDVVLGGAEEEDPGRMVLERKSHRDGALDRHLPPLLLPRCAHFLEDRIGGDILRQHHLAGLQRVPDLGILVQLHPVIAEGGILERRHHRAVGVSRLGQDDGAAADPEPLRHPPHQHLEDLIRREAGCHLLQDVHHLRARPRHRPRLVELAPDPEMSLHPGEEFLDPEWLGDEILGAQPQRADRRLLGRHRRDHQHRQVAPAGVVPDLLQQLEPVDLGHHDVEQQQVELVGGKVLEEVLATGNGDDIVAVLAQDPRERS